jgi:hypothetical protein
VFVPEEWEYWIRRNALCKQQWKAPFCNVGNIHKYYMGFHQIRDTRKPPGILKGHFWQSDEYLHIYDGLTHSDIYGRFMMMAKIASCL